MMKTKPLWVGFLFVLILLFLAALKVPAQTLQLGSAHVSNQTVQFQVTGPTNVYHRVDVSYDLVNWLPIDLYFDTNGVHAEQDAFDPSSVTRFYRAAELVTPDPKILDFSPEEGSAGTQVQIIGQFLPAAGQSVVEFGGVDAKIISGTSTRLVVLVPTNAVSSRVTVSSTKGTLRSDDAFVVLSNAVVRFQPPAGIQTTAFTIENNYGSGVPVPLTAADYSIPVRLGAPTLTFAVPTNSASSNLFLCALSFGAGQVIVMDANSTADALVFHNPFLFTSDPDLGPGLMSVIQSNAQVQAYAQTLASTMTRTNDPFNDPAVSNAYQAAVVAVVSGEGGAALAASLAAALAAGSPPAGATPRNPLGSSSAVVSFFLLEDISTRWVEVTASGLTLNAGIEEGHYNPLDRLVVYRDIDVDTAFPNGRLDFDPIQQHPETMPLVFPTRNVLSQERSIGANLASSRIDLVGTLVKYLTKLFDPKLVNETVVLPPGDGLYLVRGVGPGIRSFQDLAFVQSEMTSPYVRSVAINVTAAALDLASTILGDSAKNVLGKAGEMQGIAALILQQTSPGAPTVDDFVRDVYKVETYILKNAAKEEIKGVVSDFVKAAGEGAIYYNQLLKKLSTAGQFGERVWGFGKTTALETTIVMVGDPFNLPILSVTPATAAPGQVITIQFKGSTNLHAFNRFSSTDKVAFDYNETFNGEVTAVSGPDASGIQTLTVRIPDYLGSTHDGPYTMYVITQGRKGTAPFTISTEAKLTSVAPLQGFAATPNFNGSPFAGTAVRLRGVMFNAADQFYFSSNPGVVEATNKQNNGFNGGDVTLKVPNGAATGPIQILHQLLGGGTVVVTGAVFTVFGPPVINSLQPASAPLGTVLNLSADQIGLDSSVVYGQFTGSSARNVSIIAGGTALVVVPSDAHSGFFTITTPAGTNQVPFNVSPNVINTNQPGSVILIGGISPISLSHAIDIANGDALPSGNELNYVQPGYGVVNGVGTWYVGRYFNDTISISGTLINDVNFNLHFDGISGAFSGNVVVSGNNNSIGGTFYGPLTVTGTRNNFNGSTYNNTVTIAGSNNFMWNGRVHAPMIITGDENSVDGSLFTEVDGNGLTIQGNRNTGTVDIHTNRGDGLRIDGGKYNTINLNSDKGNWGNGVTLTGGAEGNTLTWYTSTYPPGAGNQGHGVALIGSAVGNQIAGRIVPNGLDGIYMDGPGVTMNTTLAECYLNGRNGVTITNGAATNSIGIIPSKGLSTAASIHNNAGSGVVLTDCGANLVCVYSLSNGLYGVLASNVKAAPGSFPINVTTSRSGRAGMRLENGTTGLYGPATLNSDHNGLEVGGMDVTNNVIGCAINTPVGNGAVLTGSGYDGSISLTVQGSSGDGVLLQGLSNSLVSVYSAEYCTNSGIHITAGSSGNHVLVASGRNLAPLDNNLNGCRVDGGSHDNVLDSLYSDYNRQDGMIFSGVGVVANNVVNSSVISNKRDGIRFEQGASGNFVGSEDTGVAFGTSEISVQTSGGAGVRVTDPGTTNNVIRNCTIGQGYGYGQAYGIIVENQAEVGSITASTFTGNNNAIVIRSGAQNGTLANLNFYQNTNDAVLIQDAANVLVGGDDASAHNEFNQGVTGIEISGPTATNIFIVNSHIAYFTNGVYLHGGAQLDAVAENNLIELNNDGVVMEGAISNQVTLSTIQNNAAQGVSISLAASNNLVSGATITGNAIGVLVSDAGSVGNVISGNSITANTLIGIQLSAGGNTQIAPPVLANYADLTVSGTSTAPDGSQVEIFRDAGNEGALFVGGGEVVDGQFEIYLDTDPATLGLVFALNGTVTDPAGNTSEFSGLPQSASPLPNVVFTASPAGKRQVFLSSGAGAAPISLTPASSDNFGAVLAGGATCNRLLYVSLVNTNEEIFAMDASAGATPTAVVATPANNYDPAWLVPCQRLIFVSDRDGNAEIYTVNLDGSNLLRLTMDPAADHAPAPTPDGNRIIFVSNRSGSNALWIMNKDGLSQQPLSGGILGTPSQPAVSPTGDWVAMAVTQNGTSEIAMIRIDGTDFRQVTSDGAHALHPTWMPDGEHIIFSSDRGGSTAKLYFIDRSGSGGIQPLPLNPNTGSEPSAGGH
jgi:TolB protein